MEDTDQNDNNEVAPADAELLAELEQRLVVHEKILEEFTLLGLDISGNVDEGFVYGPPGETDIVEGPEGEEGPEGPEAGE